ncbi:MAG TPA: hypothetical protein VHB46_13025 [Burkholderiales bacterium]|nr:hypothetical protein [Burkholderiales bacterium]
MIAAACVPVTEGVRRDAEPRQPAAAVAVAAEPARSDPERLARFYDRLLAMKGNELAAELDRSKEAFDRDRSELNRLQLALLLSLPGTTFRDDNTAIALLAPFARDKGHDGSSLRPLAVLLHSQLIELKRSDDSLQQQTARLKEEQRRSEALQQKLEALLDMEMKMIEREQNLPKKK